MMPFRTLPSTLLLLAALSFVPVSQADEPLSSTLSPGDVPWVDRYLKALEVDPDNAALRYQLGLSLLAAGENGAAVEELHRAYPSLSQTIGINFNLGIAYTRLRNPESAQLFLEQAEASGALEQQAIYPLASALYNVALLYLDDGEQDAAIEVLSRVVELAPERRDLMRLYGEVLYQAGRTAEAQEQLLRYLEIYPDDAPVRETLFALHYNRGLDAMDAKNLQEAESAFERALAVAPESPMALYYLAYIDYQQQRHAEVVNHLAVTVQSFPGDIQRSSYPLLYNAALKLFQAGEFELAARGAAPLVDEMLNETRYLALAGRIALKKEEFSAARDYFSRILQTDPADPEALKSLAKAEKELAAQLTEQGQTLYRQEDLQGAYGLFVRARELDPLAPKLRAYLKETEKRLAQASDREFELAEQAESEGDAVLALKYVRQGRELWRDAPRGAELEGRILESLELELARQLLEAQSLLAMKELPRAAEAFAMLLEIDPHNEDARQGYRQTREEIEARLEQKLDEGLQLLENGDLDNAARAFAEVLAQRPDHPSALEAVERLEALRSAMIGDELQWARRAFSEGEYAAAREHFQNVLRQHDTPPLRNEYLAFESEVEKRLAGLLKVARQARAQHDYRKALRLYRQARKVAADPETLSAEFDETLREADETMLSLLMQAREALDRQEAGNSVKLLRAVLRIEPSQAQALEMLQQARSAARAEAEALLEKGRLLHGEGALEQARLAFVQALEVDPYLQQARAALDKLDLQTRKLNEAQVERLYLEGVAYYTQGEYRLAMANWRQVLQMDLNHEKAKRNIDKAQRKLKQLKERTQ